MINRGNKNFLLVGLTGSIGSGKSSVRKMLQDSGCFTLDADEIYRELTKKGRPLLEKISDKWGDSLIDAEGNLDKRKLAEIVFSSDLELKRLELLSHPYVISHENMIVDEIMQREEQGIIIVEASLMLETGSYKRFDKIIVVTADTEKRYDRIHKRSGLSREVFDKIDKRQMLQDDKVRFADYHIKNNGTKDELSKATKRIAKQLHNDLENK